MVDKKISELDSGGTPGGTDVVPGVKGGTTVKFTIAALAIAVGASLGLGDLATLDTVGSAQIDASVALSGAPTSPTATLGTDTTQIATTAFVQDAVDALVTGGGSQLVWSSDAAPLSPSAWDDEFLDDTASAALWTLWNPGSNIAADYQQDKKRVFITASGNGGNRLGGIVQPIPSSEFTFTARLSQIARQTTGNTSVSLILTEDIDAAPTTANVLVAQFFAGATAGYNVQKWNDYTGAGASTVATGVGNVTGNTWVQVRLNGTTVFVDFSSDGETWFRVVDSHSIGWTPTHFGIGANCSQTSIDMYAIARAFRVQDGVSAFTDVATQGRLIALPFAD